uniref:Uncharacterized protein n=1 Tax=Seriola lalandi dorsalis TaxID=1841481 RepID=A0A3B4XF01_SERLL
KSIKFSPSLTSPLCVTRSTGNTCLHLCVSPQGLRPSVPPVSPPAIFASPTKLASEAGGQVEYMGPNRVQEMQKLFQVSRLYVGETVYLTAGGQSDGRILFLRFLRGEQVL